jgi:hypothetical protein
LSQKNLIFTFLFSKLWQILIIWLIKNYNITTNHLIRLLIAYCFFGFGILIQAQTTVPATGGNASGAGGTISYSVGQVVYLTITEISGSVTQGVQQPYEISVITSAEQVASCSLTCSVYPNPSSDFLTLKIGTYDSQNLSYHLYDIMGVLLENKKITGYETIIPISNFVSGTYFLKVSNASKEIKVFRIIKK